GDVGVDERQRAGPRAEFADRGDEEVQGPFGGEFEPSLLGRGPPQSGEVAVGRGGGVAPPVVEDGGDGAAEVLGLSADSGRHVPLFTERLPYTNLIMNGSCSVSQPPRDVRVWSP